MSASAASTASVAGWELFPHGADVGVRGWGATRAVLTGESLPVLKDAAAIAAGAGIGDQHNMIFSGTAVTYGHARAVVTATGMQTQMGRIAGMLKQALDEATPLQNRA